MQLHEIQIRDPYVLPLQAEQTYFLYGTTDKQPWTGPFVGFDCYSSRDLKNWDGPFEAFRPPQGFWATKNFWAPEVHAIHGAFWMAATFTTESGRRGTQILRADSPLGPFVPWSDESLTPCDWMALDGTLWEENGQIWMVFCHEWLQIHDGRICAVPLSSDLKSALGQPLTLFAASDAPWVSEKWVDLENGSRVRQCVTDGPFLYRTKGGALLMLWSSYGENGYAMGLARSQSGTVSGPWTQDEAPLWSRDGGHGMIFRAFDGTLFLTFHTPNATPRERAVFWKLEEQGETLVLRD